jgi:hypothetical protein
MLNCKREAPTPQAPAFHRHVVRSSRRLLNNLWDSGDEAMNDGGAVARSGLDIKTATDHLQPFPHAE